MLRYFIICTITILSVISGRAQNNAEQKFNQIQAMIDSNQFEVNLTIATTHRNFYLQPTTPYLDQNIRIGQDSAFIIINDTLATGYLPYFGSGYSIPQTGLRGIIFDNKMLNKVVKNKGKGKKQAIIYSFEIVGKNDYYKINMDIQYNGTCYLYINSTKRGPITYTGMVGPHSIH